VVGEEHPVHLLQRTLESGYLFHDLGAVALLLDHPDHGVEMTAYRLETIQR
jgi:hypothetical protein